jgi:hypothetical protein
MDLSMYHYLYDNVAHYDLTGAIRVSVQFPTGGLVQSACVVINPADYQDQVFEFAGAAQANMIYTLDIYGINKTQRDELTWLIKMWLDSEDIPLRDYNEGWPDYTTGYPATNVPTKMTDMEVISINLPSAPDIPPAGETPTSLRYWRRININLDFIVPSNYRPY